MNKIMGKYLVICMLVFSFSNRLIADTNFPIQRTFEWTDTFEELTLDQKKYKYQRFRDAIYSEQHPTLPMSVLEVPLDGYGELQIEVVRVSWEDYPGFVPAPADREMLQANLSFNRSVEKHRQSYYAKISFTPIVRKGNAYQRVRDIEIRVYTTPKPLINLRSPDDVLVSKLADGTIYKISVNQRGIHKLTYDFLRNDLGMNVDNIDPRNISVLGDRGGMLASHLAVIPEEDVPELPISIAGEADGSLDPGDYILFYAEGPNKWSYNTGSGRFEMEKNVFDQKNHYFIKVGNLPGKRIASTANLDNTDYNTSTFDDFDQFEEDKVNLLFEWGKDLSKSQGSGRQWFGDHFRNLREYTYDDLFTFPNRVASAPIYVSARMALRALTRSNFLLELNGQQLSSALATNNIPVLSGEGDNERNYAEYALLKDSLILDGESFNFRVNYPFPRPNDGSEGWLDYIQVNVRRNLVLTGDQLSFRDKNSLMASAATYRLSNAGNDVVIWDITQPLNPLLQESQLNGQEQSFGASAEVLRSFVAFRPGSALLVPEAAGNVDNQNLHGIENADMIIIHAPEFEQEARRLAEHRSENDDLNITLVSLQQVMNEFAAGAKDPTAIRNFARLLFERNQRFRYLLLFGDGSFDSRDIYEEGGDLIPTYQSDSFNPLFAFPADDYFAILETNEERNPLSGRLNISIGRLPVNTAEEARAVVDKIINYDSNPETYSDWRNQLVFVGDDEDSGRHLNDVDLIAEKIGRQNPSFNLEKIYLDAFPQVSTPGGNRFPSVNEAIDNSLFKGTLVVTYLGHGGPNGWAQERILNISDINNWDNENRLPIFITATCTFGGYDDVTFTTAGEEVILNPRGGAVALLTTTRAVFASSNADLTESVLDEIFSRENNRIQTLGEAMTNAKNSISSSFTNTNSRKFTLLGDPSQKLAIPEYEVKTEQINGVTITDNTMDTIRALQRVTLEGVILKTDGTVFENFNGRIFPVVFDKKVSATTLGQDPRSPIRSFSVQKNILFKGRSTVSNGRFKFTFVVPKDINYEFGNGKISYYASDQDQLLDAGGAFSEIIIGGADPNVISDDKGPDVNVFMNSEDFAFGGITDENPVLLVKLEDENGINVVGNSIGHDLEGILDDDTQNTLLLNDFYESELDDYTKGEVRFPLSNLEEGLHNIKVKAWDVANNSSEGYTEFVVANSGEIALKHVLNYPNPFTDQTCFQFDHNIKGQELEIMVQIFTVSGRLVKTLEKIVLSDGAIRGDDCIEWNGRDDYGDRLARGIYLYKVKVRTNSANPLSQESDFEKLVILK